MSVSNLTRLLAAFATTSLLVACGGGGGATTAASAGPVTSTLNFQFKTAFVNDFNQSQTSPFTISGTINGVAVGGSGTETSSSPSPATFESIVGFSKFSSVTSTITGAGQRIPVNSTATSYYDSNYNPLGSSSSSEYMVVTSGIPLPATVKVGDTNSWFSGTRYSSSTKSLTLGSISLSYVVEPDTASTVIVKILAVTKNTLNTVTSQSTEAYRLQASGARAHLYSTAVDPSAGTLTLTY